MFNLHVVNTAISAVHLDKRVGFVTESPLSSVIVQDKSTIFVDLDVPVVFGHVSHISPVSGSHGVFFVHEVQCHSIVDDQVGLQVVTSHVEVENVSR